MFLVSGSVSLPYSITVIKVISVQYNGGLLPVIILLTLLCDYIGEPF